MENTQPSTIPSPEDLPPGLSDDELQEIDDLLLGFDDDSHRIDAWDFYDGFLTALVCTRETIGEHEWLPVMFQDAQALANVVEGHPLGLVAPFTDAAQQQRFIDLCQLRMAQAAALLDLPVQSLDEEHAFLPDIMDMRGAVLTLPPEAQQEAGQKGDAGAIPDFGQIWVLGFMHAVNFWEHEWAPPRDKEQARWLQQSLDCLAQLLEPDRAPWVLNFHQDDGPPSLSQQRLDAYGEAVWALYDLRQLWKNLGPRVLPRVSHKVGRNDLCWCGSGKKFKKCHGA